MSLINRNLILVIMSVVGAIVICPPSVDGQSEVLSTELSPKGDIEIQYIREDSTWYHMDIWLIYKQDTTQRFMADSATFLGTKAFLSPDENWLTENVEVVSDFRTVLLFKRIHGIQFIRVDSSDIYDKAVKFLAGSKHLTQVPSFGHSIAEFIRWLPNSKAFVLSLGGWDDPHGVAVGNWTCLFNVETLSITSDRNNHGKFVRGH